jgi:hypothetical protein
MRNIDNMNDNAGGSPDSSPEQEPVFNPIPNPSLTQVVSPTVSISLKFTKLFFHFKYIAMNSVTVLKLGPEFLKLFLTSFFPPCKILRIDFFPVVLESICGGSPVRRNLLFVQLPNADGSTGRAEGSDALIAGTRFRVPLIISV